jgi:hypothetical protein
MRCVYMEERVARVLPIRRKLTERRLRPKLVHQFLIALSGTGRLVWRRIQVPQKYSFRDLHASPSRAR